MCKSKIKNNVTKQIQKSAAANNEHARYMLQCSKTHNLPKQTFTNVFMNFCVRLMKQGTLITGIVFLKLQKKFSARPTQSENFHHHWKILKNTN